jgi:K(+)-stimulated pyrophosphate-energized sodium pump
MSSNQNVVDTGSRNGLYKWVAIILALLLILLWWMGYGPWGSKCNPGLAEAPAPTAATPAPIAAAPTPTPAPVAKAPEPAAAAPAAPPAAPTLTMKPEASVPAAKVYFGLDKTNLPGDVDKTLAAVVAYLKTNADSKASVSGFHDPSGDKAHNEDLALNRARAVRGELEKLGIPNDRVIMEKATETTGTGKPAEARRVEVTVVRPQ